MGSYKQKGFSLIELLVSLIIIGVLTGLSIPLIRRGYLESMYKKDIAKFEESVGQAQALANAVNSRNCATTEKQSHITIEKVSETTYHLVTYCVDKDSPGVPAPAPNPVPYSFEVSMLDASSSSPFATFYRGSEVTPSSPGFILQNGTNVCTITVNQFGVISKTATAGVCP